MDGVYVIFILVEHHLSFFFYFYSLITLDLRSVEQESKKSKLRLYHFELIRLSVFFQ